MQNRSKPHTRVPCRNHWLSHLPPHNTHPRMHQGARVSHVFQTHHHEPTTVQDAMCKQTDDKLMIPLARERKLWCHSSRKTVRVMCAWVARLEDGSLHRIFTKIETAITPASPPTHWLRFIYRTYLRTAECVATGLEQLRRLFGVSFLMV